MGRVNIPILILNIIVLGVSLSLIIYALIAQTCASILLMLPIGLLLLVCPLTCFIVTLIGKSKFSIYIRDKPTPIARSVVKTDLDTPLSVEEITELDKIEKEMIK